jgi:hypothetical protein
MNEASKQALLSAVRSLLVIFGSVLSAKGYTDDQTVQAVIGAVMVVITTLWGVVDKYTAEKATKTREVVAVNAGIAIADATPGPTPPAMPRDVPEIIAAAKEKGLNP